jgi:hypothetical protein
LLELRKVGIPEETKKEDLGQWLYDYLRELVSKSEVYRMADCFESCAKTTGLLVLLDGLDEISTTSYPRVEQAIQQFGTYLAELSISNAIVLTLRIQFHAQVKNAYADTFPHTAFLKPFNPTDIYEFLSRWSYVSERERNIHRIYNALTARPTLREMCTNPLVLSMYVAEDQATGIVTSPESRTDFYAKVTEELLIRRRTKQIGSSAAGVKLREQRQRILGTIAFEHLLDPAQAANSLQWSSALRTVRNVTNCDEEEAADIFREISKETGLVTEERPGESFRFIHLTFCEFLAAAETTTGRPDGWRVLIQAHREFRSRTEAHLHTRLLEVIPFAAGLLPRFKRNEALDDVVKIADSGLSARAFLETKNYEHSLWPTFIEDERDRILQTPEERWDEVWLRDVYLFNVVVADANECSKHVRINSGVIELGVFFQSLFDRQENSLSRLLTAYAAQDAAAAFGLAEACRVDLAQSFPDIVIKSCDQAPFFSMVKQQVATESHASKKWLWLLIEAALRSRVVASWMAQTPPDNNLAVQIQKLPKTARWFNHETPLSFYTQCLTIANGQEMSFNPILTRLRDLPAPVKQELGTLTSSLVTFLPLFLIVLAGVAMVGTNARLRLIDRMKTTNVLVPELTKTAAAIRNYNKGHLKEGTLEGLRLWWRDFLSMTSDGHFNNGTGNIEYEWDLLVRRELGDISGTGREILVTLDQTQRVNRLVEHGVIGDGIRLVYNNDSFAQFKLETLASPSSRTRYTVEDSPLTSSTQDKEEDLLFATYFLRTAPRTGSYDERYLPGERYLPDVRDPFSDAEDLAIALLITTPPEALSRITNYVMDPLGRRALSVRPQNPFLDRDLRELSFQLLSRSRDGIKQIIGVSLESFLKAVQSAAKQKKAEAVEQLMGTVPLQPIEAGWAAFPIAGDLTVSLILLPLAAVVVYRGTVIRRAYWYLIYHDWTVPRNLANMSSLRFRLLRLTTPDRLISAREFRMFFGKTVGASYMDLLNLLGKRPLV